MLDPTQLRYFLAIAQHGNITQAAKALHTSQPTLTVALKNLEEELGTTLFFRERTGVRLTATGDELVRVTREVFEVMNRGEQRIRGLEKDDTGTFVVGCHESLGAYVLPGFMAQFLPAHPGIEIALANGTSEETVNAVLERKVHFGLAVNPHPHADLVLVPLFHDALDVLITPDAAPPRDEDVAAVDESDEDLAIAIARLRAGPIIYAGRVTQCQELLNQLAAKGYLPTKHLVCGDLELVKSLALAGIGPALLPRRVARYGHLGRLVRLHTTLPSIPDTIYLVYRADLHKTRAASLVKDALVKHGKALEKGPSMTTLAD